MRDLNHQLKQLCRRNRNGGYATQRNRERLLSMTADQLLLLGFPFVFQGLSIKALYMVAPGCDWADTRSSKIAEQLSPGLEGAHNALHAPQDQAELFRLIKANSMARKDGEGIFCHKETVMRGGS